MFLRLLCAAAVVSAFACGPTIEFPKDEPGSTGTPPPDPATTASTSPPPPPSTSTTGPTSTTTSTTSADESEVSDEGIDFIEEPDGGICVVSGDGHWHCLECDLWSQDCPRGEKCTPWANDGETHANANRCSPIVDDPGQPGEPCVAEGSPVSGIDDCALGSMCWGADPETLVGTCRAHCMGSESDIQCPPSTTCLIELDGASIVCLPDCDPLGDDCDPGDACVPATEGFVCTPSSFDTAAGEPCVYFDACAPGLQCLPAANVAPSCDMSTGCCTPWCDRSAPDPAAGCFDPAQECLPWWEGAPPPGLETLGICGTSAP